MNIGIDIFFYRLLKKEIEHRRDLHAECLTEGSFASEAEARFYVGYLRALKDVLADCDVVKDKISES